MDEVEQIFDSEPRSRFVENGTREDENVSVATGQTDGEHYFIVPFVLKMVGEALILSTRDMELKERKGHERKSIIRF